ncbi:CHAT domain-containing protein [Janibacter sp. G56]|uniref:CHAT domain-containing protein n=1 Tax=Janibacter sp. G56 TaxID=3418717 RepID=UPI003D08AFCB
MLRATQGPGAADLPRDLADRSKVTLALSLHLRQHRDEALALLDEVDATPGLTPATRALSAIQRAGLLGRSGRWRESLAALRSVDPDAGLPPQAATVLALNRGLAEQLVHEFAASRASLEQAAALAEEHGLDALHFMTLYNLGRLAFVTGDLTSALRLMGRADALDVDMHRSTANLDLARVLLDAGLLDEAADRLGDAESEATRIGERHDLGEITMERARLALLLDDPEAAAVHARSAVAAFRRRGEEPWRVRAELLHLEADLAAGHRLEAVARRAGELADDGAVASGVGHEATLLASEAEVAIGDLPRARARLATLSRGSGLTFPQRLHRDLVHASAAIAEGDPARASRRLRAAASALAREQARYVGTEARTARALHTRRLSDLDIGLALESGNALRVLTSSERWRAVSQRLRTLAPPADEDLAQLVAALRQTRSELAEADDAHREALADKASRLERTIARHDWDRADAEGGSALAAASGRALVAAAAQRSTGLVSIVVRAGRVHAVSTDGDRTWVTDLGPSDDLVDLAERVAAGLVTSSRVADPHLRSVVRRGLDRDLGRVSALLAPALPGTESVAVVPSRLLASLPWRALPDLRGRPVMVSPTATFWAGRAETWAPGTAPAVTAFAGPGLTRASCEVDAVARDWSGTAVRGPAATGSALTHALRSADIVHVAAHGRHHDQSPLFSEVLLEDGPVFAHEFQRAGVGARHVVLSACEVGRAHVRPGEEPMGLTASLLGCGVRSVVAAVAPVTDEAASAIMTGYHRALARGLEAHRALEVAAADVDGGELFCAYGAPWSVRVDPDATGATR